MPPPPSYSDCRLPRAGLGNRLFTWARAKLYADRHGLPMLAPRWAQVCVGPILRRQADWRWYTGLFRPAPGEVGRARSEWLRATAAAAPEPADLDAPPPAGRVVFEGLADAFGRLNPHHAPVRRALLAASRPKWAAHGTAPPPAPIVMHVRRGDFVKPASMADLLTTGNVQTPTDWFTAALTAVRRAAGRDVPAFVLSDGRPEELGGLFRLPEVRMGGTGSALGDIWQMSRANLLIGSGGSTFSLWSAYLGQMPAVFPPGQDPSYYKLANASGRYVGVFDPWQPNPAVLGELAAAVR
jgi:hypothetical protein